MMAAGASSLLGVVAVVIAGAAALAAHDLGKWLGLGPLAGHMGQHILVMNAVAPILALGFLHLAPRSVPSWSPLTRLALATAAQIVLLWGWHVPPVLQLAWQHWWLLWAMHATLFAVALFFWLAVFSVDGTECWKPIAMLLITGKLFCLLGALLVFAPRPLYQIAHGHHGAASAWTGSTLEDQQLAGLLMIAICPLTYVVAGVVIAAQWVVALETDRPRLAAVATAKV
jgi:putative membrane protein